MILTTVCCINVIVSPVISFLKFQSMAVLVFTVLSCKLSTVYRVDELLIRVRVTTKNTCFTKYTFRG